jgi:hypothetical protein
MMEIGAWKECGSARKQPGTLPGNERFEFVLHGVDRAPGEQYGKRPALFGRRGDRGIVRDQGFLWDLGHIISSFEVAKGNTIRWHSFCPIPGPFVLQRPRNHEANHGRLRDRLDDMP